MGNRTYDNNTVSSVTTSKTQSYDGASNRMLSAAVNGTTNRTFSYDGAGNMTQDNRPGEAFVFTYNKRNRPSAVTRNALAYATYGYNALEQLTTRSTAAVGGPVGNVAYLYDLEGHIIAEATASTGATTRDYIWQASNDNGPIDLPLAVADISGTTSTVSFVHTDHLGRPIRVTDAAKATVWQAFYKPWGEPVTLSGTKANNIRFPGQYFQIETGLAYNHHRHYDPTTGRYTQPDPLRFVDGPSIYAYSGNSPFMRTDRSGEETTIIIWGSGVFDNNNHAGIFITGKTAEGNFVYDPGGSYVPSSGPLGGGRAAGGSDAGSLNDFTQQSGGNCSCTTYSFNTTPKQESAIIKRILKQGDPGAFYCATGVRNAITGIGPFKKISAGGTGISFPTYLGSDLGNTPKVSVGKSDLK